MILFNFRPIEFNKSPVPLLQLESTFFVSKMSLFYDIIAFSSPSEVKVLKLSTKTDFNILSRLKSADECSSPFEDSVSFVEDFTQLVGASTTFNPYLTIPFTSAPLKSPEKISDSLKFPSTLTKNYNFRLLVISTNKNGVKKLKSHYYKLMPPLLGLNASPIQAVEEILWAQNAKKSMLATLKPYSAEIQERLSEERKIAEELRIAEELKIKEEAK